MLAETIPGPPSTSFRPCQPSRVYYNYYYCYYCYYYDNDYYYYHYDCYYYYRYKYYYDYCYYDYYHYHHTNTKILRISLKTIAQRFAFICPKSIVQYAVKTTENLALKHEKASGSFSRGVWKFSGSLAPAGSTESERICRILQTAAVRFSGNLQRNGG